MRANARAAVRALCGVLALAMGLALTACSAGVPDDYQVYRTAQRGDSAVDAPVLPGGAEPATQPLPTRWSGAASSAWFRIQPDLAQLQDRAIFIPRAANRVELWVNGRFVARWGERGVSAYDQGKHPLWSPLDAGHLRVGPNDVWLRVESDSGGMAGLSEVYVGSYTATKRLYHVQWLAEMGTAIATLVATFLLGLMGLAWGWRTGETNFKIFGWAALAWSLRAAPALFVSGGDISTWLYLVSDLGYGLFVALISLFGLIQMKIYRGAVRWNVRGLLLLTALLVPLGHTLGTEHPQILDVWFFCLLVSATWTAPLVLRQAWHLPSTVNLIFVAAALLSVGFGLHDFLIIQLSDAGFGRVSLMRFAALVFLGAMVAILLEKHLQTLRLEMNLNQELSERIGMREAELQAIHNAQAQAQNKEVLRAERERLTRDMHDGMGMHLQVLQALLKQPEHSARDLDDTVQNAIDQLRLTVDAISPVEKDIPAILAQLRYRLGERLAAAGIKLQWDVGLFPGSAQLTPEQAVQLQYLFFEVFGNVIKHARASTLHVRAAYESGSAQAQCVEFSDNGCGFDTALAGAGNGLKNMRTRARVLGASLQLVSRVGDGTRITLRC